DLEGLAQLENSVSILAFEELRERGLALDERPARQIDTVEMQEVECVVDEVRFSGLQRVLQRREIADAVRVRDDDLTVDQRGRHVELRERSRDRLEPVGPVE